MQTIIHDTTIITADDTGSVFEGAAMVIEEDRIAESLDRRELTVGDEGNDTEDWQRLSVLESTYREAFDNEYSSSRYRARSRRLRRRRKSPPRRSCRPPRSPLRRRRPPARA